MIQSFACRETEALHHGTQKRDRPLPRPLWPVAHRKLDALDAALRLDDLRIPPGNQLEALRGDRSGQHSIRINDQYRLCFVW